MFPRVSMKLTDTGSTECGGERWQYEQDKQVLECINFQGKIPQLCVPAVILSNCFT